ncbi:MAG: hypothetical protein HY774_17300 [Acidobacteria bacterium]|nr:hypothetical protein [Acidobacteriota bacterium]
MTTPELDQQCTTFATELEAYLSKIVTLGNFELEVEVSVREPHQVWVNFSGEDVPLLLGHNAELLNTLEYLASRVFARYLRGEIRLRFDAGSYRAHREHELRLMATAAAERVKRFGRPFTLAPMTSFERRIIHTALLEDTSVRTESIGDGEERKVVIHPA